jgi:hypothetical protein
MHLPTDSDGKYEMPVMPVKLFSEFFQYRAVFNHLTVIRQNDVRIRTDCVLHQRQLLTHLELQIDRLPVALDEALSPRIKTVCLAA